MFLLTYFFMFYFLEESWEERQKGENLIRARCQIQLIRYQMHSHQNSDVYCGTGQHGRRGQYMNYCFEGVVVKAEVLNACSPRDVTQHEKEGKVRPELEYQHLSYEKEQRRSITVNGHKRQCGTQHGSMELIMSER